MTQVIDDFDAREVELDSFEPLPEGTYKADIVNSELKETKAGTGPPQAQSALARLPLLLRPPCQSPRDYRDGASTNR